MNYLSPMQLPGHVQLAVPYPFAAPGALWTGPGSLLSCSQPFYVLVSKSSAFYGVCQLKSENQSTGILGKSRNFCKQNKNHPCRTCKNGDYFAENQLTEGKSYGKIVIHNACSMAMRLSFHSQFIMTGDGMQVENDQKVATHPGVSNTQNSKERL